MQSNDPIFNQVKRAGIPYANHASDLYIPVNSYTSKLVDQYEYRSNITTFKSQIDGLLWYDIPFAYLPYWSAKQNTAI